VSVMNFEAFTVVMFQVKVFWIVTPCSAVVGYQHSTFTLHGVTIQTTSIWKCPFSLSCLFRHFRWN